MRYFPYHQTEIYMMILIIMQNFVLILELILKLSLSCGSDSYSWTTLIRLKYYGAEERSHYLHFIPCWSRAEIFIGWEHWDRWVLRMHERLSFFFTIYFLVNWHLLWSLNPPFVLSEMGRWRWKTKNLSWETCSRLCSSFKEGGTRTTERNEGNVEV